MDALWFLIPFSLLASAFFLVVSAISMRLAADQSEGMCEHTTGKVEAVDMLPLVMANGETQVLVSYDISFACEGREEPETQTIWCSQWLAGARRVGDEIDVSYEKGNPKACAITEAAEAASAASAQLADWAARAAVAGIASAAILVLVSFFMG